MRIIAIEGLDKSGKYSIVHKLALQLKRLNYTVKTMEYPNYETPTGQLIKKWLHGEWPVSAETFELLQCADKQAGQQQLIEWEEQGVDFVIIDRYLHSQLAYGSYANDWHWVKGLSLKIRRPDVVFYCLVDPKTSMSRQGQHGDNDRYESDLNLLTTLGRLYQQAFNSTPDVPVKFIDANQPLPDEIREATQRMSNYLIDNDLLKDGPFKAD